MLTFCCATACNEDIIEIQYQAQPLPDFVNRVMFYMLILQAKPA